jgi:hypothetical protein
MIRVRNIAKIIIPVLLVGVICFLTNSTINQHFHKLSSGIILKHSHPFNKENTGKPFQEHHHTSSELVILDQLSNIVFWVYLFCIFPVPVLVAYNIKRIVPVPVFKNPDHYFTLSNRAPPAFTY